MTYQEMMHPTEGFDILVATDEDGKIVRITDSYDQDQEIEVSQAVLEHLQAEIDEEIVH